VRVAKLLLIIRALAFLTSRSAAQAEALLFDHPFSQQPAHEGFGPVIDVRVHGRLESFVLDTGSSPSFVVSEAAPRLRGHAGGPTCRHALQIRLGRETRVPARWRWPRMLRARSRSRSTWSSGNPHDHHRRSVYIFVRRNTPYPLLDTFDWANPQLVHNKREVTTTAPQALALINSDLVFEWSKALAGRVIREAGPKESAQIDRLFEILYARKPDSVERSRLQAFLDSQEALTRQQLV
jgi:hypothetical protein